MAASHASNQRRVRPGSQVLILPTVGPTYGNTGGAIQNGFLRMIPRTDIHLFNISPSTPPAATRPPAAAMPPVQACLFPKCRGGLGASPSRRPLVS